jgi:DNA-binding Xre family transcriptional regulator
VRFSTLEGVCRPAACQPGAFLTYDFEDRAHLAGACEPDR